MGACLYATVWVCACVGLFFAVSSAYLLPRAALWRHKNDNFLRAFKESAVFCITANYLAMLKTWLQVGYSSYCEKLLVDLVYHALHIVYRTDDNADVCFWPFVGLFQFRQLPFTANKACHTYKGGWLGFESKLATRPRVCTIIYYTFRKSCVNTSYILSHSWFHTRLQSRWHLNSSPYLYLWGCAMGSAPHAPQFLEARNIGYSTRNVKLSRQIKLASSLVNVWAHYKIVWLIELLTERNRWMFSNVLFMEIIYILESRTEVMTAGSYLFLDTVKAII